jgi:ABC-2 type transport system permease protein
MKKYWFIFSIYWQEGLSRRASFLMERFRALVLLISFYYFWSALLKNRSSFAGYDRTQMITYVLGMNILRGLVFATRTEEIAGEINHGRLSSYLLKPVNFMLYAFFRDLSEKSINLVSAIIEILGLIYLFHMPIRWPATGTTWLLFIASALGAMWMYFILSFMTACWGFWTSEAWGPRFLLELFLEFTAGAFFPIDILPHYAQQVIKSFPSPYLVFFPLQIFLGKIDSTQIMNGFLVQVFWMIALSGLARWVWLKGMENYSAAGS